MFDATSTTPRKTPGYVWSAIAVLILIVGVIMAIFLAPERERLPVLVITLALSAGAAWLALRAFYDAQPLPGEPVPAPLPLNLQRDQPWRSRTSLRFLEQLKETLTQQEKMLELLYQNAVNAYDHIHTSSGRLEYDRRLEVIMAYREGYSAVSVRETILELTDRIDRLFAGEVDYEVRGLEQSIQKLKRTRQERERELHEASARCTITHKNADELERCRRQTEARRSDLHRYIHDIDFELIELETHVRELKEFDFKRLYHELGLPGPPRLLSLDSAHIQDIRTKAGLLQGIPEVGPKQPPPPPPPQRSKEEEEIARIVSAIDSIEGLKRAWTAKKRNSPEEQHALIDRLFRKAIDARLEKL